VNKIPGGKDTKWPKDGTQIFMSVMMGYDLSLPIYLIPALSRGEGSDLTLFMFKLCWTTDY